MCSHRLQILKQMSSWSECEYGWGELNGYSVWQGENGWSAWGSWTNWRDWQRSDDHRDTQHGSWECDASWHGSSWGDEISIKILSVSGEVKPLHICADAPISNLKVMLSQDLPQFHEAKFFLGNVELCSGSSCRAVGLSTGSEVTLVVSASSACAMEIVCKWFDEECESHKEMGAALNCVEYTRTTTAHDDSQSEYVEEATAALYFLAALGDLSDADSDCLLSMLLDWPYLVFHTEEDAALAVAFAKTLGSVCNAQAVLHQIMLGYENSGSGNFDSVSSLLFPIALAEAVSRNVELSKPDLALAVRLSIMELQSYDPISTHDPRFGVTKLVVEALRPVCKLASLLGDKNASDRLRLVLSAMCNGSVFDQAPCEEALRLLAQC